MKRISNCLKKPEIREIDIGRYKGKKGDSIHIYAWDKYKVKGVIVSILDSTGKDIETNIAVEISRGTGLNRNLQFSEKSNRS